MAFELEFIMNGDRTLWKGVVDEERNAYMCHSFGSSRDLYREYELNYQGHIIVIQVDQHGQTRNKETGVIIERYEAGKPKPPVVYVSIINLRSINKPAACPLNKEEVENLVVEAFEAQGDASLRRESDGGAEVSFYPGYEFKTSENSPKAAESPDEARKRLVQELASGLKTA